MKKVEIVLVILSIVSCILMLEKVSGSGFLTTVFFLSLMIYYLFFGFLLLNGIPLKSIFKKQPYKQSGWKRLVLAFFSCVTYVISLLGILFTLSKWPAAPMLLKSGTVLVLLIAAFTLIAHLNKPNNFLRGLLWRGAVLLLVGVTLIIIYSI